MFNDHELILHTHRHRFALGRRLYQFRAGGQQYWLKAQIAERHAETEAGFHNELGFYQWASNRISHILPARIETLGMLGQERTTGDILILPHASSMFAVSVHELSFNIVVKRIEQLLDCLHDYEQSGCIHGDLKPDHCVIFNNRVCLIDFEQSDSASMHPPPGITATPRYMAPELFHGAQKSIGSDLYALGVMLYEWLNHTRLTAKSYREWAYLHCQTFDLQLVHEYSGLYPLLDGLLKKQFSQRFTSVSEAKCTFDQLKLTI